KLLVPHRQTKPTQTAAGGAQRTAPACPGRSIGRSRKSRQLTQILQECSASAACPADNLHRVLGVYRSMVRLSIVPACSQTSDPPIVQGRLPAACSRGSARKAHRESQKQSESIKSPKQRPPDFPRIATAEYGAYRTSVRLRLAPLSRFRRKES